MMFARVCVLLAVAGFVCCVHVVMDRANVTYFNKKYLTYGRIYVTRFSRKSPYYLNLEGNLTHTWANNVTFHLIFYEYLHNEYRRSFVEMHYKVCDFINDKYVGGIVANAGVVCPVVAADYHIMNLTIPGENLPGVWPLKKARLDGTFVTHSGEVIVKGYIQATYTDEKKKKKQG